MDQKQETRKTEKKKSIQIGNKSIKLREDKRTSE